MYIKQVIIQGFKTYKEQVVVEFDPHVNAILGKNGTGKSNIYDAIQFVLSDKYSSLRTEERQRLLHEGSGKDILSASVEIIFDNTDGRFPIEREEVSLKRTIGLKKDEYFLDNKHMSKQDVMSLLESAGLSRSNPYYIVQQGKISKLIKMKDSERLELLKEIAGTRTYDDRRKESLKIMKDTDNRLEQITEVITSLEKRLSELESEKSELRDFQKLDTQRRSLEYTVYDQELKLANEKLESIENARRDVDGKTNSAHGEVQAIQKKRQDAEDSFRTLQQEITRHEAQRSRLQSELRVLLKQKATITLEVKDKQVKLKEDADTKKKAESELSTLNRDITQTQAKLDKLKAELESKSSAEVEAKERVTRTEQRQNELYAKQQRSSQFKSKKERDAHLKKQIKQTQQDLEKEQAHITSWEQTNSELTSSLDRSRSEIDKKRTEIERMKDKANELNANLATAKENRDRASQERKELQRRELSISGQYQGYSAALEKAEKELQSTMDRDTFRGLSFIRRIVREENIQGCHGPLIELITCETAFIKAVEVTGGASLFHYVVDTDEIATKLVKRLNREKAGRITFIPLNRLKTIEPSYPKTPDVIPMIDKLQYEPQYRKAVMQVFGKTLVARDLHVATQVAHTSNINTITLSGDRVDKKGAMTGGYIYTKVSRLEAQMAIRRAAEEFESVEGEKTQVKNALEKADQQVTSYMSQIQKLTDEKARLVQQKSVLDAEIKQLEEEITLAETTTIKNDKSIHTAKLAAGRKEQQLKSYQEELESDMTDGLSAEDAAELERLITEIDTLQSTLLQRTRERSAAETAVAKLESMLRTNLIKRRDELIAIMESPETEQESEELEREAHDLEELEGQVNEINRQIKELDTELDTKSSRIKQLQTDIENLKNEEMNKSRALQKESKSIEKLLNKRTVYLAKKEDCQKKIRDLGSLPSEAFEKYRDKTVSQLMSQLEKVNEKLKKYSHVNKKAIDQFITFSDQRTELMKRKEELDKGRVGIMDLIAHLDAKKDEAIERTFKGVALQFAKVFAELVPGGKGTLVIQTRKAREEKEEGEEEEEEEEEEKHGGHIPTKSYTGVGIKVSFPGSSSATHQLSGGQESVVALSLIFAIQRLDPSPFYLFDEIDHALDAVYRTAVARLIKNQAKDTQFILTTFHPELLQICDKFFGVSFQNKVSKIAVISFEEAQQLIQVEEKEHE